MTTHKIDKYRDERYIETVSDFSASLTSMFAIRYFTAQADGLVYNINNGKTSDLIPLFSSMKCFWNRQRVIVFPIIREKYDTRMQEMEDYITKLKKRLDRGLRVKPDYEKIKDMEKLYQDLLIIMQNVGCGFAIRKEKNLEERLNNALMK